MTQFEKIKNMNVDELADFLIMLSESTTTEYDYEDNPYDYTEIIYQTPFEKYPSWFSYEDVFEDTKEILLKESWL